MRVAIHQPNFLPWMGLFNKMALCDLFVVLDHVQASHGSSWLSRNKLLIRGESTWLTVPIKRSGRGLQRINEVEISYDRYFVSKHLRIIRANYGKAPYFEEVFPVLSEILKQRYCRIADLNMALIIWLCSYLKLSVPLVKTSDLRENNPALAVASGNDLLLNICLSLGAKSYVSGNGCLDFIDPASFEDAGITFHFQRFEHPTYRQVGCAEFVSHLSILDALLNISPEETARMISQPGLSLAAERDKV